MHGVILSRKKKGRDYSLQVLSLYFLFPKARCQPVVGPFHKGTDRRSSVGFSEIQGTCSQCDTVRFKIVLHPSFCRAQQTQRDTHSSGPSWFLEKYIPDHSTTFLLPASLSKQYILLFIALHFFKPLLTQALLRPVSSFFPVLTKAEQFSRALRCSEHMEEELLCSQQKVAVSLNS